MLSIENQLSAELKVRPDQVKSAVALLDGGATVPDMRRSFDRRGQIDNVSTVRVNLIYARQQTF